MHKIKKMQTLIFKYKVEDHFNDLRTVMIDGEVWFVAIDVAKVLGYSNPRDAVARHCKQRGVVKHDIPSISGLQSMTLINEPNIYRLVIKSQLPSAEKFEEWIFEEVLPSIRKNGSYGINRIETPNFIIRYNLNFGRTERGYFSVINELYIRLYARFEHIGYKIPNRAIGGKEMRPDNSVGMLFSKYMLNNHASLCDNYKMYEHWFPNISTTFHCKQYKNELLHIFIKFVDDVWIPEHAEHYFKDRDELALKFLPKLLRAC